MHVPWWKIIIFFPLAAIPGALAAAFLFTILRCIELGQWSFPVVFDFYIGMFQSTYLNWLAITFILGLYFVFRYKQGTKKRHSPVGLGLIWAVLLTLILAPFQIALYFTDPTVASVMSFFIAGLLDEPISGFLCGFSLAFLIKKVDKTLPEQ